MKKSFYLLLGLLLAVLALPSVSVAQETDGYNPNSLYPIHESDILYKKRVWRRMDLREKQNRPFFASNNEITKVIIDAVKEGKLQPYENDSLSRRMSKERFLEQLKLPEVGGGLSDEEIALGFSDSDDGWGGGGDDGWGDDGGSGGEGEEQDYFFPNEISILELQEDIIFDKKRSRLYYDLQSIKLVIPAEKFETGLIREVAVFRYKDLAKLFKEKPSEAIWFNPWNSQEHRNLADALALRLFNARIIKVENPQDSYIVDVYNKSPKQGILASQWLEDQIVEFEHDLWEF